MYDQFYNHTHQQRGAGQGEAEKCILGGTARIERTRKAGVS